MTKTIFIGETSVEIVSQSCAFCHKLTPIEELDHLNRCAECRELYSR